MTTQIESPSDRANKALRGWITEAVGTGAADVDQLIAFVADQIREAVDRRHEELSHIVKSAEPFIGKDGVRTLMVEFDHTAEGDRR